MNKLANVADDVVSRIKFKIKVSKVAKGPQFASEELLNRHFSDHGKQYGKITKTEYLENAQKLVNSEPGENILVKTRMKNGTMDTLYYNKQTNDFAIKSSEGKIRTMYKPKKGIEYFHKQN